MQNKYENKRNSITMKENPETTTKKCGERQKAPNSSHQQCLIGANME